MNEQVLTTMTSASSAPGDQLGPGLRQHAHHHLAVHEVLGAAQAYKTNLGGGHRLAVSVVARERCW